MARGAVFIFIVAVGMPILWAFLRQAERHGTVSFLGICPTLRADDPERFAKAIRNYRLQLFSLPIIALLVAVCMELSD